MEVVDEGFIRRAVEAADPNVLRMALYQATRDEALLAMPVRRKIIRGGATSQVELVPEYHDAVRKAAAQFLLGNRVTAQAALDQATIKALLENYAGEPLSDREFAYRSNFLSLKDYQFGVGWSKPGFQVPEGFSVIIIGAGFSGIAAAVQFEQLGIPYTIYERRSEAGGVWSINTYPDARVDTSSFTYQFTFEKRFPWSEFFARGSEVRDYLEHVAKGHGIYENIAFNTELKRAVFNEETARWDLDIRHTGTGEEERVSSNILVSGAGLFGVSKKLDIPGIGAFEGEVVHTTAWPPKGGVEGKKVAVIGNGSTGVQLLSSIARDADHVSVFQRTPQWIAPREGYGDPVPEPMQWLLQNMPFYWNWYCFHMFSIPVRTQDLHEYDREWMASGGQISQRNDTVRSVLTNYIKEQVDNRADLYEHLIPTCPPMARRLIVDNNWYKTLLKPNVEFVPTGIEGFTPHGIRTVDGKERSVDLVVAAVGFEVEKYLWPVEYVGVGGVRLEDAWSGGTGPMAYLGMTVPNFPNLFIMYGPNSQARTGSLPSWTEIWSRYIALAIVEMVESGHNQISVKADITKNYNDAMDEYTKELVWTDPTVLSRNYWMHASGRPITNVPWNVDDLYERLSAPNFADFDMK